jgi:predicted DNA-binding protein
MEKPMKQILLEIDDETAEQLEAVAPARSRRRSDFIRAAIHKALWEVQEARTAEAYRLRPDDEPAHFDASVWEVREGAPAGAAPRKRPAKRKTR